MGISYGPSLDQFIAANSKAEQPRLAGARITRDNLMDTLKSINVSDDALQSTAKAVEAVSSIPGMMVEAREGRLIASTGGQEAFELPVFQKQNILTKGGTSWFSIGSVTNFDATGKTSTNKTFANWFNQTISDLANVTGDAKDRRVSLQNQVSRVFGQLGKDGDGARAMVEPLSSSGRRKYGQAVAKQSVTAFHFPEEHKVAEALTGMKEAALDTIKSMGANKDVKQKLDVEQVKRLSYAQRLYAAANASQPGTFFSDTVFSVTSKSIIDPLIDQKGAFPMLTALQPSDLVLFGDSSQAAKGFSQLRHAAFITHDKLGVSGATSAQTAAGVPSAIKPDRMTPIVQTRARFEWDKAASAIEGKKGTFTPVGKVLTFVDPAMADAFLKDSGAIRSISSHVNSPAMSTMGQTYTKSISVKSTDDLLYQGMLSPKLQKAIKDELKKRGSRNSMQTLEFGTYSGQHRGLGLSLDDDIIGFNYSSDSPDGLPSGEKAGKKKVLLDDAGDTIEGIKIRGGQIELAIKRASNRGSLGGSLIVGEAGRRVTAPRTMELRTESGVAADLLGDFQTYDEVDGKFTLAPEKGLHNSKGGDFYRRQFMTVAGRVEKRFGKPGLEKFAESFGLTVEDRFKGSPTLVAEPGLEMDYKKGLGNFRVAMSKTLREQLGTSDEVRLDRAFKELFQTEETLLDKNTVKQLLSERGTINADGILDPTTGERVRLDSVEGSRLFEGHRNAMRVTVHDDIIVERMDRVTSVGIKSDGRSAAQLKASRLGYVKEAITTRGMVASQAAAKALNDFNDLVINQGMVKSNPFVFDELKRLADPFIGGNGLGTGSSAKSIYATRGGGVDLADFRASAKAGTPVPLHMLQGSFYYDQTTQGLSKTGATLDLGHNVALSAGRMSSKPGGIIPRGVEASKIYIPSPASVLNSGADEAVFLRSKGGVQGTYVELIDAISAYGKTGKPLTKGEADRVGALYNKFQVEFAEDQIGKGKSVSKAALNPTFAKYGALGSLPHLKADTVGLTKESLMEMLNKSQFKGEMRERIIERAKSGDLKLGFLADPMGTREHYRGVALKLLDDADVSAMAEHGSKLDTKPAIYLSESLLKIANRDLDADQATVSLLSSITEHVQEMGKPGSEDLFELEQRALNHMHRAQAEAIGDIETRMFDKVTGAFKGYFDRGGTMETDFSMAGAGRLVSGPIGPEDMAKITLSKSDPGVRTPVPEVWWQKQSGVANLVYQQRLQGQASSRAKADTVSEVVGMIVNRSDNKAVNRAAISDLIEVMMQSQGNASQFHNAIKYGLLLKSVNKEAGKADATLAFWADLDDATNSYRRHTNLSQLATDELNTLTNSILGVMTDGKHAPGMADAELKELLIEAKHPVGFAGSQDPVAFARITARELVAGNLVSEMSGYKNPMDIVAKDQKNLLGTAEGFAGQESRINKSGGALSQITSWMKRLLGEAPSGNLADELADAESYDGRARARAAQVGIDPIRFAEEEAASRAAGGGSAEGPTGRIDYDQLKQDFGRFKADMSNYWSGLDETVKGRTKLGLGIAAGVAGIEIIRSTVSGFVGPGHATPTAPMPPQPLLSEPNDPTFDSRALPQHNRTRIQRTSGMRTHTQVSAQADFPIDLTAIPGAFVGELNTTMQSTGSIRDGRNNQAMLDEEARRRLYAAY